MVEFDRAAFGISRRAWVVALTGLTLAGAATMLPGPAARGCMHSKGCAFVPGQPLLAAAATLAVGTALSVWIGAMPRNRVVGWAAAIGMLAGLAAGTSVALGLPEQISWDLRTACGVGVLGFLAAWAVQIPLGLVAASLPPLFTPAMPRAEYHREHRPRWLQDVDATVAALWRGRGRLRDTELQQIFELASSLTQSSEMPRAVVRGADRLRALLVSDLQGQALREAVLVELRGLMALGDARDPYREAEGA
ncbi:MAG: hypothetical protein U0168_17555 [Nannocystaceae bacterium]|jgi:hypothetical protein